MTTPFDPQHTAFQTLFSLALPSPASAFDTTAFLSRLEALRGQMSELDRYDRVLVEASAAGGAAVTALASLAVDPPREAGFAPAEPDQGSAPDYASEAAAPDTALTPEASAGAMGGGFWAYLLTIVGRTIDVIDGLTDYIGDYLDQPGLSPRAAEFMESLLEMLDDVLERIDTLLELVDQWAPPSYDDWIDDLRDRVQEERDDIEAILSPPEPVDDPVDAPAAPKTPGETPADDAPDAEWRAEDFKGDGKTVVVIDTGWNTEFLGTDERPVDHFDFYANDADAQVSHGNDHGSWVDQVIRTVADGVEMIHLKVFPDTNGGAPFSVIERALNWVIDKVEKEAYDISAVNLSLGYGNVTREVSTGLSNEFAALDDLGVFSIVAAGNSGASGVQYLAADENTIAVSASTSSGGITGFSQHHSDLTDIFALGQSVRIEAEDGSYDTVSGTSFAAPYVSGIAARLQDAADELIDRSLTDGEFVDILQASGDDLNGYASANGPVGYHIADADAAVNYFIDNYTDFV